MTPNALQAIAAKYQLDYRKILPPQSGYRNYSYPIVLNNGAMVNLIVYKNEPNMLARIVRTNKVANFAAKNGMPARTTYSAKIMQLKASQRVRYAALYHYLPGNTIAWEAYTMDHLKELGATMSNLHAAMHDYDVIDLPDAADECLQLNSRMQRYFNDSGVTQALQQKLGLQTRIGDFTKLLQLCQKLPNQQALHMDFVRGNILFTDKKITGILDFEKTAKGHPVFDIARTLAFLLVDCKYKTPQKIRKYFLASGYQKRGAAPFWHLQHNQFDVLEDLIKFFLVHDFYKFLRHNPYEFLPSNEHFVRTKALLLSHDLIQQK